jgi:hypothetical protein
MKSLIALNALMASLLLCSFQGIAQDHAESATKRFKPFVGATYNWHSMEDYYTTDGELGTRPSQFPGLEVGFLLEPKSSDRWSLEYRNSFLLELALYEIADLTQNPYNGIFNNAVDITINNGFLGRLDIGKTLLRSDSKSLQAGFVISDKVIFGTDNYPGPVYNTDPSISYTADGFHFTPGFFTSYFNTFNNSSQLSINLSFTQSLFNLHQWEEDPIPSNFTLPLFTELDLRFQMANGLYAHAGVIFMTPYQRLHNDARIRVGAGYQFRNK